MAKAQRAACARSMGHKMDNTLKFETGRLADLPRRIRDSVGGLELQEEMINLPADELKKASVVLVTLSLCNGGYTRDGHACLILNKRSSQVRQSGDLCYPGGGLSWRKDRFLARLLDLPGSPLRRWQRKRRLPSKSGSLRLLLAAGLREAWEEMRLNPLRFEFLGVLPKQHLVMFDRVIYPMVGWVAPHRLTPNWEVDRIVPIALQELLDPRRYHRFRPTVNSRGPGSRQPLRYEDFPCFVHQDDGGREMLWGATYRITQHLLKLVFDFNPPHIESLPLAQRHLDETYLNGSRWHPRAADRRGQADW
jgi:8-oxo-dGTP pyrophosphatase MutT (NUDIX family)